MPPPPPPPSMENAALIAAVTAAVTAAMAQMSNNGSGGGVNSSTNGQRPGRSGDCTFVSQPLIMFFQSFPSILHLDPGSRSVPDPPKNDTNNDTGFTFPGPNPQIGSENGDATKSSEFGDQKTSSRAPLVERMAARAGHNALRLNTEIIKSSDNSQTQQSPYLFSPGVSPTSFLESPVFLSNSLVQPSPTTGKFLFFPNGNGRSSMMFLDSSNRVKENFFEDTNNTSFAFKPFPDSAPVSRDHVNPPFMSTQSFQHNETLVQSERQFPPQKIEPTQNETSALHIRSGFLNGNSERSQEHH
ncbi:hypothetical protein Lser_V15G32283 [Lactuca serriola]